MARLVGYVRTGFGESPLNFTARAGIHKPRTRALELLRIRMQLAQITAARHRVGTENLPLNVERVVIALVLDKDVEALRDRGPSGGFL